MLRYTAQVIRGFVRSTPVVESYALPLRISRLVIAPKFAPGQMKEDPDHGFRVCVNTLINKWQRMKSRSCMDASITCCKWLVSVHIGPFPFFEESKRLTAFHTPDETHCWNRLMILNLTQALCRYPYVGVSLLPNVIRSYPDRLPPAHHPGF
jgi:hypothetical protein